MDCLQGNCNATSNDRMVSCWLCLGCYHIKCCGLRARDADALADHGKSLHWTCSACKNVKIDFYKFFRDYKECFDQLSKEFVSVQSKLTIFGELFSKFQSLDQFDAFEKSSDSKKKKTPNLAPPTPSMSSSPMNVSPNYATVNDVFVLPSTSSNGTSSQTDFSSAINSVSNLPNTKSPVLLPVTQTSDNLTLDHQLLIKPLKAVPRRKSIFVSRLASDTSPEDVGYYIKSKIGQNADISIHKFKFSEPRTISSFKLAVSDELFDYIIDPSFWPVNTLVREFTQMDRRKPNSVGILPQKEGDVSKN